MNVIENVAGNETWAQFGFRGDEWADLGRKSWELGAGGRTRTDMSVTSPDFESGAYTNFATPAFGSGHNSLLLS